MQGRGYEDLKGESDRGGKQKKMRHWRNIKGVPSSVWDNSGPTKTCEKHRGRGFKERLTLSILDTLGLGL